MVQALESAPRRAAGRVPPHNLEAEESLLGAMLLSRDAISAATEIGLSAADFYKPAHAHIFDAVLSLYGQGEPVDPVTVADELRRVDLLDQLGGRQALLRLQAQTPASANASHYAHIVNELALLRRLIFVAGEISEMGYDDSGEVAETLDRAESLVFEVAERRVADTMTGVSDALQDTLDQLEALYGSDGEITGVETGYVDLDSLLLGLQPSNLVVVAARPGAGKCVAWDTPIVDARTGDLRTAAEMHRLGTAGSEVSVLALDDHWRLHDVAPSAFVDDGMKPVYRVRTRSGREIRTTSTHPFLTPTGWLPLGEIAVGSRIAVPRTIPVFGDTELSDDEISLLGLLVGGEHTDTSPRVTTDLTGGPRGGPALRDGARRRGAAARRRLLLRHHVGAELRERPLPDARDPGLARARAASASRRLPAAAAAGRALPQPALRHPRLGRRAPRRPHDHRVPHGLGAARTRRRASAPALRHHHPSPSATGATPRRTRLPLGAHDLRRGVGAPVLHGDRRARTGGGDRASRGPGASRAREPSRRHAAGRGLGADPEPTRWQRAPRRASTASRHRRAAHRRPGPAEVARAVGRGRCDRVRRRGSGVRPHGPTTAQLRRRRRAGAQHRVRARRCRQRRHVDAPAGALLLDGDGHARAHQATARGRGAGRDAQPADGPDPRGRVDAPLTRRRSSRRGAAVHRRQPALHRHGDARQGAAHEGAPRRPRSRGRRLPPADDAEHVEASREPPGRGGGDLAAA